MRTSGLGFSVFLMVAGAILAWAVSYDAEGVDLNQVGIIMFVAGLGLGLVTLALDLMGRRTVVDSQTESTIDGQQRVDHRRDVVSQG